MRKPKTPKTARCRREGCGKVIPIERVYAALSRGQQPKYCSDTCRNTAKMRRQRAKGLG